MKKTTTQKILRVFGILYLLSGIVFTILAILALTKTSPELDERILNSSSSFIESIEDITMFGYIGLIVTTICFFSGWALLRFVKDDRKTGLALFVLAFSFFATFSNLEAVNFDFSNIATISNLIIAIIDIALLTRIASYNNKRQY